MLMKRMSVVAVTLGLMVAVAACSDDDKKAINETVARNTIATAGAKQFGDSDYPVEGALNCKVQSKTTTEVTVGCDGTTENNEPVALLGTTSDARQVKGTFAGTVNGKQVFKTDCLGC